MSENTSIEWTDNSWTPIRARNEAGRKGHFCEKISPGCKNCYASRMQSRFGMFPYLVENRDKVELLLDEKTLLRPLSWKLPKRVFVCSMTDLFYEGHSNEWLDKIFAVMALCPQHTFQVLTKRPDRMLKYLTSGPWGQIEMCVEDIATLETNCGRTGLMWPKQACAIERIPLPNVHLGVSCENRATKHRIDTLRKVPSSVRFLSLEPLLEDLGELDLSGISWTIVGGESGPGARPCNTTWIREIVLQCHAVGVPCFVKQLGAHVIQNGERRIKADKKGGDMDEWPHDLRVRQFPKV